jgi:hypothetical protein
VIFLRLGQAKKTTADRATAMSAGAVAETIGTVRVMYQNIRAKITATIVIIQRKIYM